MAIAKIPIEEEFATVMLDSKSKLDTGSELTSPVFLSLDQTTLELTILEYRLIIFFFLKKSRKI